MYRAKGEPGRGGWARHLGHPGHLGRLAGLLALAGPLLLLGAGGAPAAQAAGPFDRLTHFIVIYQENWSFDSLYGSFPGANGLANAGAAARQVDKDGQPYATLPRPIDTNLTPAGPDPRFPADLPVAPFDISRFVAPTARHGDP